MVKTLLRILFLSLIFFSSRTEAQYTSTSGVSSTQLINSLVGQGATVTNVTINCPGAAYGTYTANGTNLGVTSGVVLTTGSTALAGGANNNGSAGQDNGTSSNDPQLTGLEPQATFDACIIEFDIVPSCATLSINYVFGSEEYPEFVCSTFNDVFGFFISGPNPGGGNYTNTNIALVPGTSIPVAINSVNSGTPGFGYAASGCTSLGYSSFYQDNSAGTSIQYDGFTRPLTATASVVPCSTYHMKIAIADAGDGIYDSGVFFSYQGLNCPSAPAVTVNTAGTTICPGQSVTLTASGATTYTWTPPAGLNTTSGPSVVATPASTTTYTVTGSVSCSVTIDTVIVNVIPALVTASPDASICPGGSTTLSASGASTYTWNPAAGLSSTNISNPVASPAVTTTYTVTGTTAANCIDMDEVIVTVTPLIVSAGSDASICTGGSTTLNASGATTYTWSPAASLSSSTSANPVASPSSSTTYTVTGTTGTCTDTDEVVVSVGAMVVTASADTLICSGGTAQLSVSGGTSFSWSPGGGLSSTTAQNPSASPATTTTYTVTGSSGTCSASDIVVVNVTSITVNAGTDVTICEGSNTTLSATGGTTYTWTPVTGLSSSTVASPVASPSSTTTYTVTGTTGFCTSSDQVVVSVTSLPVLTVSPDAMICSGSSANLSVSGATIYTWNPSATLNNGSVSNPTATPSITTTYTVTGTTSNCTSTATTVVAVNPIPVITASNDTVLCNGGSAQLNASGATTYSWSPSAGLNNAAISNPVATPSSTTTYTVTGTTNGCSSTEEVIVNVGSASINAGADVSICNGASTNLSATGGFASVSWSPATGLSDPNISNPVASPASTTTYTVSGVSGTCNSTDQVIVTVNSLPAVLTSADDSICPGGSTIITASGASTYTWNPSLGLSDPALSNPSASPASTTTYTVTGTMNGCISTADVIVTVNPVPPVTAGNDVSICPGSSTTLLASGGTDYTWSPAGSLSSSSTASTVATPSSTTTYTVTGTSLGCSATDQVIVTVMPVLAINAGNDTIICPGSFANLHVSGATTYQWSPSASLDDANSAFPVATPSTTTTYTVTGTTNSCTGTDQIVVTVPQPLVITPAAYDATCYNVCNGQAIAVPGGGTSPYTFSWSTIPPVTTPALANACAGTYTVSITDYFGCSTDTSIVVNQPAEMTSSSSSIAANCFHADGSATASASGGNPGYAFTWNTTPAQSGPTATNLVPGTYTYTVSDNNNCSLVSNVVVGNIPGVVASIDTNNPPVNTSCFNFCDGSATAAGTGGTSPYIYSWSTSPAQLSATATGLCAGTYTVVVGDNNLCFDTTYVTITQPTPVSVNATGNDTICIGQSTPLNVSSSGGTPSYNFSWWPSTDLSDPTSASPTADPAQTTTYSVTSFDQNNCPSDTGVVIVSVNPPLQITAAPGTTICILDSATISVQNSSGGNGGPYNYSWSPSSGLSSTTGSSVTANPQTTTTYTVVMTDNCTLLPDTDYVIVNINPLPLVSFFSSDTSGCVPHTTVLQNTTPNTASVVWTFEDGGSSTDPNPTYTFEPEGTYDVSLTVTDGNGCTNSATINDYIVVHGFPEANFTMSPQPTTVVNPTIEFTDLSSGSPVNWNWYFEDLDSAYTQHPTYTFPDSGYYDVQLVVVNEYGCVDDTTLKVRIDPDFMIFVPNAFTPNNDGKNDLFYPVGYGWDDASFEMHIFDRWGNLIYKSNDIRKGWDGRANNGSAAAQEDTYVWKIKVKAIVDARTREYIGKVSIIK